MKLTMEAFKNVKSSCNEMRKLCDLESMERFSEIVSEINYLDQAVTGAINTLNTINDCRDSLVKCGYSDEWYDHIHEINGFEGLVTFNMPKFFDNNANREKVCMEGFIEAAKEWIKRIWEQLKQIFKYIKSAIDWFIKNFASQDHQETRVMDQLKKMVDGVKDQYFTNNRITVENYWDMEFIKRQIDNVTKFATGLYTGGNINPIFGLNIEDLDTREAKKSFFDRIVAVCDEVGVDRNDVDTCGMLFKFDAGSSSLVKFFGVEIKKEFPKTSLQIDSAQDLDIMYQTLMTNWSPSFHGVTNILSNLRGALNNRLFAYQSMIDNFDSTTGDPDYLRQAQVGLIITNCLLITISSAINYFKVVWTKVHDNRKQLAAVLKSIK